MTTPPAPPELHVRSFRRTTEHLLTGHEPGCDAQYLMGLGLFEAAECKCVLDAQPSYSYQIHFQDDDLFRWAGHFDGFVEQIIGEVEGDPDEIADRRLDWTEFRPPFKLPDGVAYEVAQAMAYGVFDNLEIHYRWTPGDRMVMFVAVNIRENGSRWSTPLIVVSDRPFDEGWMYEDPTSLLVTTSVAVLPAAVTPAENATGGDDEAIRPVPAGYGVQLPHRAAVGTPEVGPVRYNGCMPGSTATVAAWRLAQ